MFFNQFLIFLLTSSSYFKFNIFLNSCYPKTIIYFFIFSTLCVFFACVCVFSKNIIHVLFSLVLVFILSSGCLFCINVEFLAIVFVMVYVGAIIVLFLFAIMLLNFRIVTHYYVENFIVLIMFLFSYMYTHL